MYAYRSEVLDQHDRIVVARGIDTSGLVGDSQLGPQFKSTRGFSVVFTDSGIMQFRVALPWLQPYFDAVRFPASNSFYINVLSMKGGSRVEPHIDMRVLQKDGQVIVPNLVSVYYLKTPPEGSGGEIVFYFADKEVRKTPVGNDMVIFKGNVWHSVEAIHGAYERVSIVCEQYNLDDSDKLHFPEFGVYHECGVVDENPRVLEQEAAK